MVPNVEIDKFGELIIKNIDTEQNIDTLYIKDTTRHFIENITDIYLYEDNKEKQVICVDLKAAWGIRAEDLSHISKKYNIDLKIYAFERGMEFNQDIEIVEGKIIKDNEIKFNDYIWECINPEIGG